MPASPSENRGRWRKRKRESQIGRRQQKKHHDEDDGDEEEEENLNATADEDHDDDSEDQSHHHNPQSATNPQPRHEIEVLSDHAVQISQFPVVIKRSVNRPHSSVAAIVALERANDCGDGGGSNRQLQNAPLLENVSHGQLQALSTVPADSTALDQDRGGDGSNSSFVISPPPILEGRGVVKRFGNRVLVVPMHSDWFSPASVHRLERQVVPHFFSGKSADHTPEKYMECRNYIVALYMEDLGKRITASDCQGLLVGVDNEDLTRIFRFLDHWGIVNYCARVPCHEHANDMCCLKENTSGEVQVPSDFLKSIDSLIKFDKPKCKVRADEICSSLTTQNADASDLDDRIREHLSENHCNYCSRSLPVVYYQSQKEVDILLCTDCFHDGRFVIGHSSLDFMRVDSTRDYGELDGDNWSDQETLLLLEAMEIYNENWNEIAEHVGTKSKAQCILHFLRLPMEDGKLENINVPSMSLSNAMNGDDSGRLHHCLNGDSAGPLRQSIDSANRLPFANSGNPVMALVAFLASAVGPRVAASCAHAALKVLAEDTSGNISQMETPGHDNRANLESAHSRDGGPRGEMAISNNHNEDKANLGSWGQNEGTTPLSSEKVKDAAKAGLSAAATKAKLFADHEEREIQRLCANIVNHQLKRLELKLKQFAEIETLLMKECEQVERTRQRFAAERSRIMSARLGTGGATPPMNTSGAGPSMANSNGNSRQQMISASPSQPSISGYGNNQPVHPHMSFGPRPSMFGLGQRLPLSMIQQSQSPSNAMFNSPSNVQPTSNHPLLRSVSVHDFGACFHYQEEKAIERGILPLLQRATLVQTFGQRNHVCLKDGSITIPPYAPPQKMHAHLIPEKTPRSIFVYFRGLFYDVGNDPEGGYYARGARAAVWENFKDNPLFDISTDHPTTYYEDMQRAVFCLCPLGWAPWSPRLVEAVVFGCIPVIIADDIVLPFADAIPWEDIGVFVDEEDVAQLDTILTSIPPEVILRKQRLLANPSMKQAMLFPQPAKPGDAFHQVLNGLARKLPHDRSIFLKQGEKVLNWTAGPVGDLKPW